MAYRTQSSSQSAVFGTGVTTARRPVNRTVKIADIASGSAAAATLKGYYTPRESHRDGLLQDKTAQQSTTDAHTEMVPTFLTGTYQWSISLEQLTKAQPKDQISVRHLTGVASKRQKSDDTYLQQPTTRVANC